MSHFIICKRRFALMIASFVGAVALSGALALSGAGVCFAQPASNATARSTCPFFFQSGSNIADLFGILMYSTSVGTIDLANCSSTHFAVASVTDMRGA